MNDTERLEWLARHEVDFTFALRGRLGKTEIYQVDCHTTIEQGASTTSWGMRGRTDPADLRRAIDAAAEVELRQDGATTGLRGSQVDSQQSKVVEIPVIKPESAIPNVPSLSRAGMLQGKIVRIGGKQDPVSVELQDVDGQIYLCKASREVAKKLAREMFDVTIRVHGHGRWTRDSDGIWRVDEFQISPVFDILDTDSLIDVLRDLRAIQSGWKTHDDPDAEVQMIRSGVPHEP